MIYPDYLMHFGVKGMHWGVRKDRGSKGSGRSALTPEQRAERTRKLKKAGRIAAQVGGAAAMAGAIYGIHRDRRRVINLGQATGLLSPNAAKYRHTENRIRTAKTAARVGLGLGGLALSEKLRKDSYNEKNKVDAASKRRASNIIGVASGLASPVAATLPYAIYRAHDNNKRYKEKMRNSGRRRQK